MPFFLFIFILNLPWTILGLIEALLSIPTRVQIFKKPTAFVIHVRSFWWRAWFPGNKGVRGSAIGHVVLLGPTADSKDLAHELIHIEQFQRAPLIQPILYLFQSMRYGYRQNKYEKEAYAKSGSPYDTP